MTCISLGDIKDWVFLQTQIDSPEEEKSREI